jgi:hypothetical protein
MRRARAAAAAEGAAAKQGVEGEGRQRHEAVEADDVRSNLLCELWSHSLRATHAVELK